MFEHSVPVPRLYKAAANIVENVNKNSVYSIKNLVYQNNHRNTKALYALVVETLKYSKQLEFLFKRTKILEKEPRLNPWLARVLITELLWGKKRLSSESKPVKTVLAYQQVLNAHASDAHENSSAEEKVRKPRYVRVNTLLTTIKDVLEGFRDEGWTFVRYMETKNYDEYLDKIANLSENEFMIDIHIPELLIFPPNTEFYSHQAYKTGFIVLQDKASCLPTLLLNPSPGSAVLDMCAAPGMKTSHLAAKLNNNGKIYAVDVDTERLKTLETLMQKLGVTCVETINKDILSVTHSKCPEVEYILVDPSCSGSGIVDRLDLFEPRQKDENRVQKLRRFQIMILKHAFRRFSNAKRVVYSTCSVYPEENEEVVEEVLSQTTRFKLINASELIKGPWYSFGSDKYGDIGKFCLYCKPDVDMTNGFFVAVFDRLQDGEENKFFKKNLTFQEVEMIKDFSKNKKQKNDEKYRDNKDTSKSHGKLLKGENIEDNVIQENKSEDYIDKLTTCNKSSQKKKKKRHKNEDENINKNSSNIAMKSAKNLVCENEEKKCGNSLNNKVNDIIDKSVEKDVRKIGVKSYSDGKHKKDVNKVISELEEMQHKDSAIASSLSTDNTSKNPKIKHEIEHVHNEKVNIPVNTAKHKKKKNKNINIGDSTNSADTCKTDENKRKEMSCLTSEASYTMEDCINKDEEIGFQKNKKRKHKEKNLDKTAHKNAQHILERNDTDVAPKEIGKTQQNFEQLNVGGNSVENGERMKGVLCISNKNKIKTSETNDTVKAIEQREISSDINFDERKKKHKKKDLTKTVDVGRNINDIKKHVNAAINDDEVVETGSEKYKKYRSNDFSDEISNKEVQCVEKHTSDNFFLQLIDLCTNEVEMKKAESKNKNLEDDITQLASDDNNKIYDENALSLEKKERKVRGMENSNRDNGIIGDTSINNNFENYKKKKRERRDSQSAKNSENIETDSLTSKKRKKKLTDIAYSEIESDKNNDSSLENCKTRKHKRKQNAKDDNIDICTSFTTKIKEKKGAGVENNETDNRIDDDENNKTFKKRKHKRKHSQDVENIETDGDRLTAKMKKKKISDLENSEIDNRTDDEKIYKKRDHNRNSQNAENVETESSNSLININENKPKSDIKEIEEVTFEFIKQFLKKKQKEKHKNIVDNEFID